MVGRNLMLDTPSHPLLRLLSWWLEHAWRPGAACWPWLTAPARAGRAQCADETAEHRTPAVTFNLPETLYSDEEPPAPGDNSSKL